MGKKLFRYWFENTPNALIMTGSMLDKTKNENLLFLYSCEMKKKNGAQEAETILHVFHSKKKIDLFVMGEFTVSDCQRLRYGIHYNGIQCVILPYVKPENRKRLLKQINAKDPKNYELCQLIQDPDAYLKCHVKKYFFIVGNGEKVLNLDEEQEFSLGLQNYELLSRIISMENKELPIRKAGGFVQKQVFICLNDCGQEFGNSKLAFFCMPVDNHRTKIDSVLQAVLFDSEQNCHTDLSEDGGKCAIQCMLYRDHHIFRHSNKTEKEWIRMGVFLSANILSNAQMDQLCDWLQDYLPLIRVLGMMSESYGKRLLKEIEKQQEKDEIFWLCPMDLQLKADELMRLIFHNPRNRFVALTKRYGCCLNGYLEKKNQSICDDI